MGFFSAKTVFGFRSDGIPMKGPTMEFGEDDWALRMVCSIYTIQSAQRISTTYNLYNVRNDEYLK
jgi:hypothetical protein